MTIDTNAERAKLDALAGYTPGPWDGVGLTVYDTCLDVVASCLTGADARLIAAAPDLLTTLRAALDEIDRLRGENDKLRTDMSGGSFYQEKDIDAMLAEIDRLREALREIATIAERRENKYPSDWRAQIEACRECQRYKDHPIQRGICDEHRKPIYEQQYHDRHETEILGYRAQDIARAALVSEPRE